MTLLHADRCVGQQVLWKDLEIQKQIGEGSFGKVFLAKWRETTVAVKQLIYTGISGSLEENDEMVQQGMNVLLQGLEQVCNFLPVLHFACIPVTLHQTIVHLILGIRCTRWLRNALVTHHCSHCVHLSAATVVC